MNRIFLLIKVLKWLKDIKFSQIMGQLILLLLKKKNNTAYLLNKKKKQ